MDLTEHEMRVMITLMTSNGCRCDDESREYIWYDVGNGFIRVSECNKCNVKIAVPVFEYR